MASSNKAFEAVAGDVSVFPRQVYKCSAAINLKTAFIPVTFIEIMADILYLVKRALVNAPIWCSTFLFFFPGPLLDE